MSKTVVTWMTAGLMGAALMASGCGGGDEASSNDGGKKRSVGLVLPGLEIEGIKRLAEGAEAAAKEQNVDLRVSGSMVAEEQVSAGQSYVSGGVGLIGLDPIDGTALAQVAEAANSANVPAISVIGPVASGDVESLVGLSYREAGSLIGKAIVDHCKGHDPCRIAVLQGNASDNAGREMYEGAKAVYSKAPNVDVVADQPADWDDAKALNAATDILTANKQVDAFFVQWESGALAALEAIRAAGRQKDDIGLFSFGGITCPYIKQMLAGNATHNVFVPWPDIGRAFVDTAVKVLDGDAVPERVDVPLYPLSAADVKQILDGDKKVNPFVSAQIKRAAAGC